MTQPLQRLRGYGDSAFNSPLNPNRRGIARGRDPVGNEHHQKPLVTAALLYLLDLNGMLWEVRLPQRRLRELARLVEVGRNIDPMVECDEI